MIVWVKFVDSKYKTGYQKWSRKVTILTWHVMFTTFFIKSFQCLWWFVIVNKSNKAWPLLLYLVLALQSHTTKPILLSLLSYKTRLLIVIYSKNLPPGEQKICTIKNIIIVLLNCWILQLCSLQFGIHRVQASFTPNSIHYSFHKTNKQYRS